MNTTTKTIATASIASLLAVAVVASVTSANEQSNKHNSLIEKISASYNIDKEELEGTFKEHHEEMKTERQAKQNERLQLLVDDGTITSEQRDTLISKRSELHESIHALKDSSESRDDIKEQVQSLHTEFKSWAEDQGIDLDSIRPEKSGHKSHKGGMHFNSNDN